MLAKYTYKYIQLQIHRLALVCWQPVSCDESESSPTVIKGHASLLNEIFGLRASPFVFLVTKFKVLDEGSIWALLSSFLSRPNFCGETVFSFNYK